MKSGNNPRFRNKTVSFKSESDEYNEFRQRPKSVHGTYEIDDFAENRKITLLADANLTISVANDFRGYRSSYRGGKRGRTGHFESRDDSHIPPRLEHEYVVRTNQHYRGFEKYGGRNGRPGSGGRGKGPSNPVRGAHSFNFAHNGRGDTSDSQNLHQQYRGIGRGRGNRGRGPRSGRGNSRRSRGGFNRRNSDRDDGSHQSENNDETEQGKSTEIVNDADCSSKASDENQWEDSGDYWKNKEDKSDCSNIDSHSEVTETKSNGKEEVEEDDDEEKVGIVNKSEEVTETQTSVSEFKEAETSDIQETSTTVDQDVENCSNIEKDSGTSNENVEESIKEKNIENTTDDKSKEEEKEEVKEEVKAVTSTEENKNSDESNPKTDE